MSKTAIIIMSDPKSGQDEATGKALNGLVAAYDFMQLNSDIKIIFQGTGTRWPAVLQKEDHIGHKLFKKIKPSILGASASCATLWDAPPSGIDLLKNNPLPGEPGLPSLAELQSEGYNILIF